ncbi:growth factor, partial [Pholiota molesta]
AKARVPTPPAPQNVTPQGGLPPGMVMGPDGKPCKICTAFRNWSPAKTSNSAQYDPNRPAQKWPAPASGTASAGPATTTNRGQSGTFAGFAALAGATTVPTSNPSAQGSSSASYRPDEPPPGCPPTASSSAARHGQKPRPRSANMLMLLGSLPDMAKHKPDVSGRVALSRWLCDRA